MKRPPKSSARVLCVDDEEAILSGLGIYLRRRFDLSTATSAAEALQKIAGEEEFAVVVSDMRMPGMNGAEFLARVREISPRTTRLLLTGESSMEDAIAAINEGKIFRFLTKPTRPRVLTDAIEQAIAQYELVTSEQVLLEQTLRGCIQTLTDLLALSNPAASGRAGQIWALVQSMAAHSEIVLSWELDVACMLSQLASITWPTEMAKRYYAGGALAPDEQALVSRMPLVARGLLGHLPRIEGVLGVLEAMALDSQHISADLPVGTGYLLLATRYFELHALAMTDSEIFESLGKTRKPGSKVDESGALLKKSVRQSTSQDRRSEVAIEDVRVGMVMAHDVYLETGVLLVAEGYTATESFVLRAANLPRALRGIRVKVSCGPTRDGGTAEVA